MRSVVVCRVERDDKVAERELCREESRVLPTRGPSGAPCVRLRVKGVHSETTTMCKGVSVRGQSMRTQSRPGPEGTQFANANPKSRAYLPGALNHVRGVIERHAEEGRSLFPRALPHPPLSHVPDVERVEIQRRGFEEKLWRGFPPGGDVCHGLCLREREREKERGKA